MVRTRATLQLILFVFVAAPVLAAEPVGRVSYVFHKEKIEFVVRAEEFLTLSVNCLKAGKLDCQAHEGALAARQAQVDPKDLIGGAEPGAILCQKFLHATVVVGTSKTGGTRSFCLFSDRSLASTGSLIRHTRRP